MAKKQAVVIGAGFGGLSAAANLAKQGYSVTVVEKNNEPGGRASTLKSGGFSWYLGPSWYMMPDVFDDFFAALGKKTADYYKLKLLSTSYRTFDNDGRPVSMHTSPQAEAVFEKLHPGDGQGLGRLLQKTAREYKVIRKNVLLSPWVSWREVFRPTVMRFVMNPWMLLPYNMRINRFIKGARGRRMLKFMTVFMGGSPKNIPGMYTLLAHVDCAMGIYYPMGGFAAVARGFENLCQDMDVKFIYKQSVTAIDHVDGKVQGISLSNGKKIPADIVVAGADYHHVQTKLLGRNNQTYWRFKTLSPSGLVICLGLKKPVKNLAHHNLFFDTDWDGHFNRVFKSHVWAKDPLFYLCAPSKTDSSVAPKGHENIYVLAPQTTMDGDPPQEQIDAAVDNIIKRIEQQTGQKIAGNITEKHVMGPSFFADHFNAYRGNAFGLAHTLWQSAIFRPRLRDRKIKGLYYVGQYTNPGTGVPMVVLSGMAVASLIAKDARGNND